VVIKSEPKAKERQKVGDWSASVKRETKQMMFGRRRRGMKQEKIYDEDIQGLAGVISLGRARTQYN